MTWTYSGTAVGHLDLLDDLRAALVAEGWTVERWTGGTELIIRGPGSGSRSDFYLGIREASSSYANLSIAGLTGYASGSAFTAQPGYSSTHIRVLNAWATPNNIPYWININDDRFILVAKVSTKYHWMAGGLLKVYGTDVQYGYPLFVLGATYTAESLAYSAVSDTWIWSLLKPAGAWAIPSVLHTPNLNLTIDDKYPVWPSYIYDSTNLYGEVEGLVGFPSVSGTNAEDTITVGSDVYWCFPNSSTVSFGNFMAVKEA